MFFYDYRISDIFSAEIEAQGRGHTHDPQGPHPIALALHHIAMDMTEDYPELVKPQERFLMLHCQAGDTGNRLDFNPDSISLGLPRDNHPQAPGLRLRVLQQLRRLGAQANDTPQETPRIVTGRVSNAISMHARIRVLATLSADLRQGPPTAQSAQIAQGCDV